MSNKPQPLTGRAGHHAATDPGETIDPIPVEIPAGTRKLPSIAQEIQAQIAIQIAKKKQG